MKKTSFQISIVSAALFFLIVSIADAHVTVKPGEAGVASYQTFTVSVPSEKESATIGIRLVIPEGVESVTPTVKPGWKIELATKKTGRQTEHDGMMIDEEITSEIRWTGGAIPEHRRDEFTFSAKVPGTAGTLQWKAYQTYADGTVVSWDKTTEEQPKNAAGQPDFSSFGPFSKTQVIDDLSAETEETKPTEPKGFAANKDTVALVLSAAALLIAISVRFKR